MPSCRSQCYLCDYPIRFDTYHGCSHGCKYCFAKTFSDISKIKKMEGPKQLKNFIEGKRNRETNWCDWDIPLHWGGMSDPFQPCEKIHRVSYECLKIFAETQYPFIVSTKGELIADNEYLELLSKCNCVVQISMVCSKYDKLENGTPTWEKRLEIVKKVAPKVKRLIIRIQPYMHEVYNDVFENLHKLKNAGAYGVIIEGMKFRKRKKGLIKIGADYTYPYKVIYNDFMKLKKEAHRVGLKIYAGENRIRKYGDSLSCCGVSDLEGFRPNTYNLNHLLNGDTNVKPTEAQKQKGTADCYNIKLTTLEGIRLKDKSFSQETIDFYTNNRDKVNKTFGIDERK